MTDADAIARFERKLDGVTHALFHLARYLIHREANPMSATTDAIKADLVALEANVDKAIANAGDVAQEAVAAEEADLADIRTHIETIGTKVEGMVPTVAAAVTPAAAASAAPLSASTVDHTTEATS